MNRVGGVDPVKGAELDREPEDRRAVPDVRSRWSVVEPVLFGRGRVAVKEGQFVDAVVDVVGGSLRVLLPRGFVREVFASDRSWRIYIVLEALSMNLLVPEHGLGRRRNVDAWLPRGRTCTPAVVG